MYFVSYFLVFQKVNLAGAAASASSCSKVIYRCRKCRSVLATSDHVFDHSPTDHQSDAHRPMTWYTLMVRPPTTTPHCQQGLFVEPLDWMTKTTPSGQGQHQLERLNCAKCNARVGSYSWKSPVQCGGCKAFMAPPAFILNVSKMDKSIMKVN